MGNSTQRPWCTRLVYTVGTCRGYNVIKGYYFKTDSKEHMDLK